MKNLLISCFIVLLFAGNSFANLEYISTEESVKRSDFIVVGTLQSISDIYIEDPNFGSVSVGDGEGILVIDKVIVGNVKTSDELILKFGDKLRLKWSEFSPCLSGWHRRTENTKGIWLLNLNADGTVKTSHPAQFASYDSLPEIRKYIKMYSQKFTKTITIRSETIPNSNISLQDNEVSKETMSEISNLSETTRYYPFLAFLVILGSMFLYYLLYRSRFKIR